MMWAVVTTVILAICRWLHREGRIRLARPDAAAHLQDQTTGWRIKAAEFARRRDANPPEPPELV